MFDSAGDDLVPLCRTSSRNSIHLRESKPFDHVVDRFRALRTVVLTIHFLIVKANDCDLLPIQLLSHHQHIQPKGCMFLHNSLKSINNTETTQQELLTPEVKITCSVDAPIKPATCARAFSSLLVNDLVTVHLYVYKPLPYTYLSFAAAP